MIDLWGDLSSGGLLFIFHGQLTHIRTLVPKNAERAAVVRASIIMANTARVYY